MLQLLITPALALPAAASSSVQISNDILSSAVTAVRYASLAYCPVSTLKAYGCQNCKTSDVTSLTSFTIKTLLDEQYVVAYNPTNNQIIVGYRGSNNFLNWVQNFDAFKQASVAVDAGTVKLHDGWYGSFKDTNRALSADVATVLAANPTASFLFVGHSSGAATAAITAFLGVQSNGWLTKLGVTPDRVSVFTTAGPRVGDQAFVDAFNKTPFKTSYRIVKGADVVTLMPPEFLNFRHFNKEIYIDSGAGGNNIPVFCDQQPASNEKGSCTNREKWLELLLKPGEIANQHLTYLGVTVQC
ncbi:Alpha/Beta hydrolase protein [Gorgonomyces haynaldii]|nr:Alpha/Beta hydrolase protein [Gorgonomyces haynaldii]